MYGLLVTELNFVPSINYCNAVLYRLLATAVKKYTVCWLLQYSNLETVPNREPVRHILAHPDSAI